MMAGTFGRVKSTLAILGVVSIGVIYAIVTQWNPLPGWANYIGKITSTDLASPAPPWTTRVGNQPDSASVLPGAIVIPTGGSVEVRNPASGAMMWSRLDSWAGVAGDSVPVVVVGRDVTAGFDVYDVATGIRKWSSNERAGVWTYTDKILILTCPSGSSCLLRAVNPDSGATLWSSTIKASGKSLIGFDHTLSGLGQVADDYSGPLSAQPKAAPTIVGLPMNGQIHLVDTETGHQLHVFTPDKSTRITVVGGHVVASSAKSRGDQCYYTAEGLSPNSGKVLWQKAGLDLRTTTPLGCEQKKDPIGVGNDMVATDTTGRDAVVSASSGNVLFRAATGERIVAMDTQIAVLRSADGTSLRAVNLGSGAKLWTHPEPKAASVCVGPTFVLVADPTGLGKLIAFGRQSGIALNSVRSSATVLGLGTDSVIISIGRTIGPVRVTPGA